LTTEVLDYDALCVAEHCGTCRACLDACPTGALVAPHVLDARRCISYLTIELRQDVPPEFREDVGDWLFGCDVCQEVCPWNRHSRVQGSDAFAPYPCSNPAALAELFTLDETTFRERFRRTPLWRAKRRGLLRNAAIVLGNHPYEPALPALIRGLNDPEPLVRGAVAWALGRYPQPGAATALRTRLAEESEPAVRKEIEFTMQRG
jgi:epoxyqueuosine reductase